MTFAQWIAAVLSVANSRGIAARVDYPAPGLATFTWQYNFGPAHGIAGAGADMARITTPVAFTELWRGSGGFPPGAGDPAEPWNRRGRYVPRVPARACSMALEVLFT